MPPRSSPPRGGTCSTRASRCSSRCSRSTSSAMRSRMRSTRRRRASDPRKLFPHRNRTEPKGRNMLRMPLKVALPLLLLVLTLGLAACGGDEEGDGGQTAEDFPPATAPPDDAKEGGTLQVIASGDIDFMDPGAGYYQFTYILDYATQR